MTEFSTVIAPQLPKLVEADDLRKIDGIGPKIAEILTKAGLDTFEQLAATTPEYLKTILEAAGQYYTRFDPESWPKQANFALHNGWEALEKWQKGDK